MNKLTRTKSGVFSLDESYTQEEIAAFAENGELESKLVSVSDLFCDYPPLTVSPKQAELVKNGVRIRKSDLKEGQSYRLFAPNGEFLSISKYIDGVLVLQKAFWQ